MRELEIVAADALEGASKRRPPPPAGSVCANCGAPLVGSYCYNCGQNADLHKRSIGRLLLEGVE
ncbi:MAG: 3'-5' exonuclease, partial [Caulobacteraceae bacterium]